MPSSTAYGTWCGRGCQWRYLPHDLPPWPVVYQQTQRWIESFVSRRWSRICACCCASSLGARRSRQRCCWIAARCSPRLSPAHGPVMTEPSGGSDRRCMRLSTHWALLAQRVTPADEQDCAPGRRTRQPGSGHHRRTRGAGLCDQGYTGQAAEEAAAAEQGIRLEVVKHTETKRGFVLPPTMGRRTKLRLGSTLPTTRTRLRTPRHYPRHLPLPRLRMPHDRQPLQTTPAKFITASRMGQSLLQPSYRDLAGWNPSHLTSRIGM